MQYLEWIQNTSLQSDYIRCGYLEEDLTQSQSDFHFATIKHTIRVDSFHARILFIWNMLFQIQWIQIPRATMGSRLNAASLTLESAFTGKHLEYLNTRMIRPGGQMSWAK